MERGGRLRSRSRTRAINPLAWMRKDRRASERRAMDSKRHFHTAAPDRDDDDADPSGRSSKLTP